MFLIIDKPKGITSHDVIDEVRKIIRDPTSPSLPAVRLSSPSKSGKAGLRGARVGHAGTLDPNATGVLVVGVGRESTKKLGDISKDTRKVYEAEIFLGEERDTDDVLGQIRNPKFENLNKPQITNHKSQTTQKSLLPLSNVKDVLNKFVGEQMQTPPAYSAIKIKGKKAYELARKGQQVKLKPRKITIYFIKLINYSFPILKIEAGVSSGTYIRAIARDIGRSLGCGAYLKNLRRTEVGKFKIEKSVNLSLLNSDNWKNFLIT
jgi:tRNA pseudouridine55 synthase